MWPIIILLAAAVCIIVSMVVMLLKKSPKFDTFVHDLTEPVEVTPKSTDRVIKDISEAEKALLAKRRMQEAEASKLQKESAKIGDYLAEKGVVKADNKKEGDKSK